MKKHVETPPAEKRLSPPLLRVTDAMGQVTEFQLTAGASAFAGSASSCQIRLPGDSVSQFHCMFSLNPDGLLVQDCGTGGETLINGSRLNADTTLNHGDQVSMGGFSAMVVLADEALPDAVETQVQDRVPAVDSDVPEVESRVTGPPVSGEPQRMIAHVPPEMPAFDPLESDLELEPWNPDSWSDSGDGENVDSAAAQQELQLLRSEIEFLQGELALRDVSSSDRGLPPSEDSCAVNNAYEEETIRLVNRLEELLDEMKLADERVRTMDDLLRASEEANQAEQEERRQMESWLGEIEKRVSLRHEEMEADAEKLRKRCEAVEQARARAEGQLRKLVSQETKNPAASAAELSENKQLRERLDQQDRLLELAQQENAELNGQLAELRQKDTTHEMRDLEQKLAAMELSTSRERAEIARQRAEFESAREEFERQYQAKSEVGETDGRFAAMRQHLREIHEEEKTLEQERRQNSLSGRIAKLLSRV